MACVNFQCVVSFSGYLLGRDHLVLPMSHYIVHLAMTYFGSHNRTNLNFNITRASRHAPSRAVATVSQVTIFDTSRESNPSSHQRFQRWAHNLSSCSTTVLYLSQARCDVRSVGLTSVRGMLCRCNCRVAKLLALSSKTLSVCCDLRIMIFCLLQALSLQH